MYKKRKPPVSGSKGGFVYAFYLIAIDKGHKIHATVIRDQDFDSVVLKLRVRFIFLFKTGRMHTNPKQNRVYVDEILVEQFRRKGYNCKEVRELSATVFIITHENKQPAKLVNESYKNLLRSN